MDVKFLRDGIIIERAERICAVGILQMKAMRGGESIINGAFQREGLVDELSLVQVPMVAGNKGKPLFFDSQLAKYELVEVEQLNGGVNWLRYVRK